MSGKHPIIWKRGYLESLFSDSGLCHLAARHDQAEELAGSCWFQLAAPLASPCMASSLSQVFPSGGRVAFPNLVSLPLKVSICPGLLCRLNRPTTGRRTLLPLPFRVPSLTPHHRPNSALLKNLTPLPLPGRLCTPAPLWLSFASTLLCLPPGSQFT